MFKKGLLILIVLLVILSSQVSLAKSVSCDSLVIYTMPPEAGPGLAVQNAPNWRYAPTMTIGKYTGQFVHIGDHLDIYATQYNTSYGDIWYQIDGGWVQAFGGYTAPIVYIITSDVFCVQDLPHYVGDWSWAEG